MRIERLRSKAELEAFFRRDPLLHLYELGDLDDFFWPRTAFHGLIDSGEIGEVALLYTAGELPVLLALSRNPDRMRLLVRSILPLLPARFYTHLSDGVSGAFAPSHALDSHGAFLKMSLEDRTRIPTAASAGSIRLGADDLAELHDLYRASYPGHWFDPRMLQTGQYFGLRREGRLVSVAGVHVYSPEYGAAALGNITTHPDYRGLGLAGIVTGALCRSLLEHVRIIGLNVKADNHAAISCYRKLGFSPVADYGEYTVRSKG